MTSPNARIVAVLFLLGCGSLAIALAAYAQQPTRQNQPATTQPATKPSTTQAATKPAASAPLTEEQEREKIWNSPEMLRARAWVADYCQNTEKMTPEEGQEYMRELENLSPKQMKLWLLQYEHQQELYAQKESAQQVAHRAAMAHATAAAPSAQQMKMWQMAHQAQLRQAMAVDRQAQQNLNSISQEESQAALQEQGQINTQRAEAFQMQENKQDELNNPYPYGYGGYGYGYGGYDGVHYHFHF